MEAEKYRICCEQKDSGRDSGVRVVWWMIIDDVVGWRLQAVGVAECEYSLEREGGGCWSGCRRGG